MPTIISQLQDDTLLAFVIPVLYNVCVDYGESGYSLITRPNTDMHQFPLNSRHQNLI
jgi:hypothetical protein